VVLDCECGTILIGDEEEAKKWKSRFSGGNSDETERQLDQLDQYISSSIAATSNTDRVSELFVRLTHGCCIDAFNTIKMG